MTGTIYLDHAATTPLDPRVREAMLPWLGGQWGNPSSLHAWGRAARAAVDGVRERVAAWLGARPAEIVFTSGGSEADSLALLGTAAARASRGRHLLTTPIEHHAVLTAAERLAEDGFEVEYLAVDGDGRVDPAELAARLRPETILVSVQAANNEIGTLQPIAELGAVCAAARVPLHVDAVQSLVEWRHDVRAEGISLLAGSAHKLYGPQGVGFLYVRTGLRPRPQILGGPQERGRRAGTENVAGIVGLGAAIQLLEAEIEARRAHCLTLRERLLAGLLALPGSHLNGPREGRLANNVNVSFDHVNGEGLLISLDQQGIAASTGSACSSGSTDPSHVLLALGGDRDIAHGSLRLTLGQSNTEAHVDRAVAAVAEALEQLRGLDPTGRAATV